MQRTIQMKLLYYDDVTVSLFIWPQLKMKLLINIWNKNPLKMEVGNVNSKHFVLESTLLLWRTSCIKEMDPSLEGLNYVL